MQEGNENNPDVVLEQQKADEALVKPSELEHVFVIILLGLLGIGAFLMIMMSGGSHFGDKDNNKSEQEDVVFGLDENILGVKSDDSGKYFVHAHSFQVLYTTRECTDECLSIWTPYTATDKVSLGNIFTIEREDTSALQYTWKGQPLYTYTLDTWDSAIGDGVDGVWQIARP